MKRIVSFYKKYFSKSFLIYISLFAIFLLLILLSIYKGFSCWLQNLFFNLGLGVFASTLVSLLIDFGDTIILNKKDKKIFERITIDLQHECSNLTEKINTAVYESLGYNSFGKLTYTEWIEYLFDFKSSDEEKQKNEIEFALQQISIIRKKASLLQECIKGYYDNQYITENFRKNLDSLIRSCRVIENNLRYKRYNDCKNLLIGNFKDIIIEMFADLKKDFCEKYDENDYI